MAALNLASSANFICSHQSSISLILIVVVAVPSSISHRPALYIYNLAFFAHLRAHGRDSPLSKSKEWTAVLKMSSCKKG